MYSEGRNQSNAKRCAVSDSFILLLPFPCVPSMVFFFFMFFFVGWFLSSCSSSSSSRTTIVRAISTAIVAVIVVSATPGSSRIGVSVFIIVVVVLVVGVGVSSGLSSCPLFQRLLVDLQYLSVPFKRIFLVFFQGGIDRCDGIVIDKGQHAVVVEVGSDDL